jgi:hypothetical protein
MELREKRMNFIEQMRKEKFFWPHFDINRIEWGMLMKAINDIGTITLRLQEDYLAIDVHVDLYEDDEKERALEVADKYVKDTLGACRQSYTFEESDGYKINYTLDIKNISLEEMLLGVRVMEKKFNGRGHWEQK